MLGDSRCERYGEVSCTTAMGPLTDPSLAAVPLIPVALCGVIALAVAGSLAVRRILLALPSDVLDEAPLPRSFVRRAFRMIVGLALVALGVALLVLPGPGVLLIALGLLACAPGSRRRLVRWTATLPRVLRAINALRRRHGRPDLALPRSFDAAHGLRVAVLDRAVLPCSPSTMKTYWDVYLEVRGSSHARTPSELGVVLSTDEASTRQALAALDKAQLVYSAVIGGMPVTYVVGKDAGTDGEAHALAARGALDVKTEVAPRVL